MLSADIISDLSHTEWLGPLLDRELTEQSGANAQTPTRG
jgi:hypothetical protein